MNQEDLIKLGETIRRIRKKNGLTINDVAIKAKLSQGLISKVENARSIPSLPVLFNIAQAIKTPLSELLDYLEDTSETRYLLTRKKERRTIKRENAKGYHYQTLLSQFMQESFFESVILNIESGSKGKTVTTDGYVFVYCLNGSLSLVLGKETIAMQEGDCILFNGSTPHMSQNHSQEPLNLLILYFMSST